ncbi:mannitol dehydrogenase family protein [Xanthobacter aminoxidans]|uniref:mannitol dehydrogenase family protein n=1 Tax=Xanthobacter aminoxidans TaxID=186280 RepID=UPI002023147D|nr:mannitol dehydrogenase family protein [Xanthobacter aminoxidans]MCL8383751.1 mannitol dehydrogenase family protein [Xanthobacter aminoxidans]
MSPRLSLSTLADLPAAVARPAYDIAAAEVGVVHLGVGAFHRAHQAAYLDAILGRGHTGWAICGASLRSPDTSDALDPQDGLYTLAERSGAGDKLRVIGSLRRLLVAPRDPEALLSAMSDPRVRIVTLTVTEKGYCHDPASGTLDEAHPDIRADLANPHRPVSAPGYLVEALARRRAAGIAPFTVLTCDNLPANGKTVARVTARLAALRDDDLGRFVAGEVAFPSTMVDRIVPATTDEDRALVAAGLGMEDAWPVMAEPFTQWVVEDHFPLGRPPLEEVGVEMVSDVAPFEHMKLRLLNGAHSTLAYLGYLAGHATIADTMAVPAFARLVARLQDEEVTPTLHLPAGVDVAAYKRALRERFANPALRHRTWQIAMDGSQKLPQRLVATARDRLAKGAPIPLLALGVAGWMRYVTGRDEQGKAIDVRDPLAARLKALADEAGPEAARLAPALLSVREVFADLGADPRFAGPVREALARLLARGAAATVEEMAGG